MFGCTEKKCKRNSKFSPYLAKSRGGKRKKIEKNRTKGKRAIVFFYGVLFIG